MSLTLTEPSTSSLRTIEHEATTHPISEIAAYLQDHLGQKITAYLSGIDNAKTVGLWIAKKNDPLDETKARLRYAYQAAKLIIEAYDDETAKAWFFGSNTLLDNEAPGYVLRYGKTPDDLRLIIPAAGSLIKFAATPVPAKAGVH
jgi:hypothetical protein